MSRRKTNSFGDRLLMVLVGLFLYAPIIILIVFSFNAGNSSSVWKGFSLHWYQQLFHNRLIMHSVYTTLMVSLLATIIATIAGTFAAIGFFAMRRKPRETLMAVNNIPMMNADIVTGVSLCLLFVVFFNGWGAFAGWVNSWQSAVVLPERLTMGFGTLLIAHICFNIPYVILSVGPKLRQMDRNLIDAAQDLGCTWMQAFWRVVIPEIKPGIVSGALTAFTMSVDDFIISYFTAGTSASTLAMTIYGMTKKRVSPEINAISTLLFVTVLVLLAIINLRDSHAARREHHAAVSAASGGPVKPHRPPNQHACQAGARARAPAPRRPRLDFDFARPRRCGRQLHAENHPRTQHVGSVAHGDNRHHVRHVQDRDHRHAGGRGRPHRIDPGQPDNAHRQPPADNPKQRRFGPGTMDFDQPLHIRRCRTPHVLRMGRHPGELGRRHG